MKYILLFVLLITALSPKAQENQSSVVFQAELFNRHYWRGFVFGDAPAIEPEVTITHKNFGLNIWAAHTFNDSYSEIDIIPSFSLGNYEISVYEYYNPIPGEENRYFDFSEEGNRHSGEIALAYNGMGKLPLQWMVSTFFYGDRHHLHNTPLYSTYIRVGYPFTLAGASAEISAGVSPWESFYSDKFAIVHTSFALEDKIHVAGGVHLPIKFSLNANPSSREAWVIFSFGIVKESNL